MRVIHSLKGDSIFVGAKILRLDYLKLRAGEGKALGRSEFCIRRCVSEGFLTIEELGLIKSGEVVFDRGLATRAGGVRQDIIAGESRGSVGI